MVELVLAIVVVVVAVLVAVEKFENITKAATSAASFQ